MNKKGGKGALKKGGLNFHFVMMGSPEYIKAFNEAINKEVQNKSFTKPLNNYGAKNI